MTLSISTATDLPIAAAGPTDTGRLARLLSDALLAGPLSDWLVPDLADRQRVYARYWATVARHALTDSRVAVDTVGAATAAALWYEAGPDGLATTPDTGVLAAACGPYRARFEAFDATLRAALPTDVARYAYLGYLAVDPLRQRNGIGRALVRHRHGELDDRGDPSFLVATTPDAARLYESEGYRPYGDVVRPDPAAPPLSPMIRVPATRP